MRKNKLQLVIGWLRVHESLSTREIYDLFIDEEPKNCPTMYELGNLLSKSKEIMKTNEMHVCFSTGTRRKINAVWILKEEGV